MDMRYFVRFDRNNCAEEYERCSVEVMREDKDKLWCIACTYMHVFDEYEYDEDTDKYEDAVERINRYGVEGNYYNDKYYVEGSFLNEQDWIIRLEDKELYVITEFIHCSGTIIATKFVKAFEVPKADGRYYVEELNSYIKVDYEEDYGWVIVP